MGDTLTIEDHELFDTQVTAKVLYPILGGGYMCRMENGAYVVADEAMIKHSNSVHGESLPPIVFFGNGRLACALLSGMVANGVQVLCAYTTPTPRGGVNPLYYTAKEIGVPVYVASMEKLLQVDYRARYAIVADFKILPPEIIEKFKRNILNLHTSLLPELRGSSTISSAILRRYEATGLTAFRISEQVDKGEVFANLCVPINPDDTATMLEERLYTLSADVACEALRNLYLGKSGMEQSEMECDYLKHGYAPRTSGSAITITANLKADTASLITRAYSCLPGVRIALKTADFGTSKQSIKIADCKLAEKEGAEVQKGDFYEQDRQLQLRMQDASIVIGRIQLPGGRWLSGSEYAKTHRGRRIIMQAK